MHSDSVSISTTPILSSFGIMLAASFHRCSSLLFNCFCFNLSNASDNFDCFVLVLFVDGCSALRSFISSSSDCTFCGWMVGVVGVAGMDGGDFSLVFVSRFLGENLLGSQLSSTAAGRFSFGDLIFVLPIVD